MNILLTSVGRRSYLVEYFRVALAGSGQVHASNSEVTVATKAADRSVVTPLIYDANYIPFLIDYAVGNKISAIISLLDIDLLVLARHADKFSAAGVRLILAPYETVRISNDKWMTFQFLRSNGISTPETFLDLDAAKAALESGTLNYPVVIKPRWGMGSIGLFFAENETELEVLYQKSRRAAFETYLRYESNQTPEQAIIIQERMRGQEYGLDVINDLGGGYVTTLAKAKLVMRAGETDVGLTVDNKPFEAVGRRLGELLRHQAIMSVDCFYAGEQVYVGELNCRISGHYPLSHLAGVNLPLQMIRWLRGEGTDLGLFQFRSGLTIAKDLRPCVLKDTTTAA